MMKKMAADSKAKGMKPGLCATVRLLAVRERLLEFYSDKTTKFTNILAFEVDNFLMVVSKVQTII